MAYTHCKTKLVRISATTVVFTIIEWLSDLYPVIVGGEQGQIITKWITCLLYKLNLNCV